MLLKNKQKDFLNKTNTSIHRHLNIISALSHFKLEYSEHPISQLAFQLWGPVGGKKKVGRWGDEFKQNVE